MIICEPGIKPKNRHLQSILASSKIRLLRLISNNPVNKLSQEVLIETKDAKLQGFYTKNEGADNLYILLHGWEGSSHSTYIQLLANALYKHKKAAIFRLNFRDHGDTHHLNKDLFHSCRLDEIVDAIKQITEQYPHKNVYLCGYSLGANFSLRVAAKADKSNVKLTKVFAVSPPINPKNSMLAIEDSKLYNTYFMKKWKKSLSKKVKHFPDNIQDSNFQNINSLKVLTEILIINHSEYKTTDEYFNDYRITEKILREIKVPCEVITSWDDPVIPFKDFNILKNKQNIKLVTSKLGGHCGFITSWKMDSWIEQYIIENSG
jgi:predicted alpha/beta-fold hydrolase